MHGGDLPTRQQLQPRRVVQRGSMATWLLQNWKMTLGAALWGCASGYYVFNEPLQSHYRRYGTTLPPSHPDFKKAAGFSDTEPGTTSGTPVVHLTEPPTAQEKAAALAALRTSPLTTVPASGFTTSNKVLPGSAASAAAADQAERESIHLVTSPGSGVLAAPSSRPAGSWGWWGRKAALSEPLHTAESSTLSSNRTDQTAAAQARFETSDTTNSATSPAEREQIYEPALPSSPHTAGTAAANAAVSTSSKTWLFPMRILPTLDLAGSSSGPPPTHVRAAALPPAGGGTDAKAGSVATSTSRRDVPAFTTTAASEESVAADGESRPREMINKERAKFARQRAAVHAGLFACSISSSDIGGKGLLDSLDGMGAKPPPKQPEKVIGEWTWW